MSLYNLLVNKDITSYNKFIKQISLFLKEKIDLNKYSNYKSGVSKERIPLNADWIYYRAASMLIKCVENPRSVKYYRQHYSSLKNRGVKPNKTYLASGFIIRHVLQILEQEGYLASNVKGRYATELAKKNILKIHNETE